MVKRVNELERMSEGETKTLPELALRYILYFDEISTVIPGMRRIRNVEANTSFSDGRKLSEQLMKELKNHAWERNFYPESWKDPSLKSSDYIEH